MNNHTKKLLIIFTIITFCSIICLTPKIYYTHNVYAETLDCLDPNNATAPECTSARLRDFQDLAVKLLYFVWAAGIPIFTALAIFIGYQFMISGDNVQKQEELKKRGLYLVIGIVLFFAAHPIASVLMKLMINSPTDCYTNLDTPGFTFFFPNVCGYCAQDAVCSETKIDGSVQCFDEEKKSKYCCLAGEIIKGDKCCYALYAPDQLCSESNLKQIHLYVKENQCVQCTNIGNDTYMWKLINCPSEIKQRKCT